MLSSTTSSSGRQGHNDDADKAGRGPTVKSILQKSCDQQQKKNNELFCEATIRNQYFLDCALQHCGAMTSQEVSRRRKSDTNATMEWATEDQISKVDSVLKSVARDWSLEGREERSVVYDKLVGALEKYLPIAAFDIADAEVNGSSDGVIRRGGPPRVAIPGSGLGRLAWEIYAKGFSAQGSDFSLPMLLASDFILNGCGGVNNEGDEDGRGGKGSHRQFAISPWLTETKNVKSLQDRLRFVVVPDVDPTCVKLRNDDDDDNEQLPEFTMLAGEFLSLYSHFLPGHSRLLDHQGQPNSNEKFNAVVCSFFIDTAPTLPHYLVTIWHILEDGGLFVNLGPLMYHWSGHGGLIPEDLDETTRNNQGDYFINAKHKQRTEHLDQRYLKSVDYTWEEARDMIIACGFEIVEEELDVKTKYTSDASSMMKVIYDCVFFVARKVVAVY